MLKIRCLKYRFFALFRRAMAEGFVWRETRALAATSGEKPRALARGVAGLLDMKKAWYRVVPGLL